MSDIDRKQEIEELNVAAELATKDVVPEKVLDTSKGDIGAEWMANYQGSRHDITSEDETRIRKKIDWHLLPIICYIYFCQQLDKSSLGYTSVFGIQKDTHLVGQDYSWLNSIVYFAQLVCQPLVVSMWWTRREQALRNSVWYSTNGLAGIIGSIMTYGIGHANNTNLHTYQLIFITCGGIAVALSIPTFFILPGHPTKARFLSDDDKYIALERIRLNNTGTQNHTFKWSHVREALLDVKCWIFMLMIFCVSLVSGGVGAFGPLILQGFGLNLFTTILYNMIPAAIGIVTNLLTGYLILVTKRKFPVLFITSLFPVGGAIALYVVPHTTENKQKLLAIFFILGFYGCMTPQILTWAFANTAGHTKKTTVTGMCFVGLTLGNIVGPQLYKTYEAPLYPTGLKGNIGCLCALTFFIVLQFFYLAYLNKKKVERRRAAGKTGHVVDLSLEASSKWRDLRQQQAQLDEEEIHHVELHNAQAFLDLTDKENDDFVYSL